MNEPRFPYRWIPCVLLVVALPLLRVPAQDGEALNAAPADFEALGQDSPTQDNIVVVLDASGSMRELMPGTSRTKMEIAKGALLRVLGAVPPSTNVGVLVFSGDKGGDAVLHPLGPVDPQLLSSAIARVRPSGGTPLGAFLKRGTDMLLERRAAQRGYGTFRLLVVTDGEASDSKLVNRYLPDILSRGVTLDVVGVAMDSDHQLATRVHSYRRANDSTALVEALTEVFAEVGGAQDDVTETEAFEVVGALPEGMAVRMIGALSGQSRLDEPVGRPVVVDSRSESAAAAARSPSAAPAASGSGSPAPAAGSGLFDRVGVFLLIVVVIVFFVKAKRIGKKRGGRHRRRR